MRDLGILQQDRNLGGRRRQLAIFLEELENIRAIRHGNAKDLENFADVLDIIIVNLREADRYDELGNGSLYIKLQKKIPQVLLSQYHRWLYEKDKVESVQTLREWIIQEAEFQTVAHEAIHGIADVTFKKGNQRTHLVHGQGNKWICKICSGDHGVWKCSVFKNLDIKGRWTAA